MSSESCRCSFDGCAGTGVAHCSPPCGGDQCICTCGGEEDCVGCDACDVEPLDLEDRLDAALAEGGGR